MSVCRWFCAVHNPRHPSRFYAPGLFGVHIKGPSFYMHATFHSDVWQFVFLRRERGNMSPVEMNTVCAKWVTDQRSVMFWRRDLSTLPESCLCLNGRLLACLLVHFWAHDEFWTWFTNWRQKSLSEKTRPHRSPSELDFWDKTKALIVSIFAIEIDFWGLYSPNEEFVVRSTSQLELFQPNKP